MILVVVDTLRADHLGSYGFRGDVSPTLDALAAESVRFERCFAPSPWTKPATASLLTSLYPDAHGLTIHPDVGPVKDDGPPRTQALSGQAVTLAEALRDAGYRTGAFVANPWVERSQGFAQGFDRFDDRGASIDTPADGLLSRAEAWLAEAREEPFFLYLHFMDVHAPYDAPKSDYDAIPATPSERVLADREMPEAMVKNLETPAEWATEAMRRDVDYWRRRYASGVRAFDRRLTPFIEHLRERGLLDGSVLVITSDHGEQLFEHGGWSHGLGLFDHQLHVPLLVRRPGGARGGAAVGEIVELTDVMPTILSLAAVRPPAGVQGRDLSGLGSGGVPAGDGVAFGSAAIAQPDLHSVRTPEHKLVMNTRTRRARLFDLAADPGETRDVAAEKADVAKALAARLDAHLEELARARLATDETTLSDEERERLDALGY